MRKNKQQTQDTFTAESTAPLLTPMDVQQKEFSVSRMGGYKMRDVDEFLDEVTTAMAALVEENRRLKERAGSGAMMGAPDLEAVSRQADEIIRRAREEAAQIVREASPAATLDPAAGATGDRAAISPFLQQERAFLQQLAGLVQEHAETVKGLAKQARARADGDRDPAAPSAAPPLPTPTATGAAADPARTDRPTEAMEEPVRVDEAGVAEHGQAEEPERDPEPAEVSPAAEEPVRVDEPEPATVGRAEGDVAESGDRSLRELFWGEDS